MNLFNTFKDNFNAQELMKNILKQHRIKRFVIAVIALFLTAVTFNLFFVPNNIVTGGTSGLSIIFHHWLNISPSLFLTVTGILLIIISFIFLGKEKTMASITGALLYPVFVKLTENIGTYIDVTKAEVLLLVIIGGVLYGVASGLTFKMGYSSGGADIIIQIINKYFHVSIGKAMMITNIIIILIGGFVFGIINVMYALIVVYLTSFIADKVILGISDSKLFYIFTSEEAKVRDLILNGLNHGVTIIDAKGGYTNHNHKIMMCVIPTKEYYVIKEAINELDKNAFFVVTDSYQVYGGE